MGGQCEKSSFARSEINREIRYEITCDATTVLSQWARQPDPRDLHRGALQSFLDASWARSRTRPSTYSSPNRGTGSGDRPCGTAAPHPSTSFSRAHPVCPAARAPGRRSGSSGQDQSGAYLAPRAVSSRQTGTVSRDQSVTKYRSRSDCSRPEKKYFCSVEPAKSTAESPSASTQTLRASRCG